MSNRFKCLLDEKRPSRIPKETNNNRYLTNNIKNKTFFQEKQDLQNDEENFPSLGNGKVNLKNNQYSISYGTILKNEEKTKKQITKKEKLKRGWIHLSAQQEEQEEQKEQEEQEPLDVYFNFVDCMVNLYEHQKNEKIEIIGEENYQAIYTFPNYDYEYFDKLDIKYEKELEKYIETYENECFGYISDNSM